MRLIAKFAALALSSAVCVAAASATTIDSNSTSTAYVGYGAAAPTTFTVGTNPTFNIPTGGVWTNPVGASSWVSFDPNSYPGGPKPFDPNGYYTYTTSFTNTDPSAAFSLTVMADDTVSVYLNGLTDEVVTQYNGNSFPKCAAGQPNCIVPLTVQFGGLTTGTNYLTFVVHQANSNAQGLDYTGTTFTPEPSSLLLLGTGLVGSAGTLFRRFRR